MNKFLSKIPLDKKLHFIVGFLIGVVFGWFNFLFGLALSFCAGIIKEIKDYVDYGGPDWKDMVVTWVGGLVGACIVQLFKI